MVHPYNLQCPGDRLEEVLAIDPSDLTYMLINAVKELDARNAALEQEVQQLRARQEELTHLIEQLSQRLAALEQAALRE